MPTSRGCLMLPYVFAVVVVMPVMCLAQSSWHLIWSDEFNGPANTSPDATKWTYDTGNNGGWGNNELENYTNLPENAHMDGNGDLVIHVEQGSAGYFSARLKTQGLFAVQYGRVEARIKLPSGQGIWPAFWMLGADIPSVGWPQCGEIDIMENRGSEPGTNHGSVHGPGYSGGSAKTSTYLLNTGRSFSDDFHTFAVQWSPASIQFYVDGTSYETVTSASIPNGAQWVFDSPFFILLNVAVGGNFAGAPNATTQFPQDMLVDYVRVYQQQLNISAPFIYQGGVVDAASFGSAMAPGELASVFGSGLADATADGLFDPVAGSFAQTSSGARILMNGVPAPLTYVSPWQINFQIPWETLVATALNIEVERDGTLSNPVTITMASAAPSVFGANGVALLKCAEADPRAGDRCTLWGNGFGTTLPSQLDGRPAPIGPLLPTVKSCSLLVGGQKATVEFCGAAPGLIVDQLNFVYPADAVAMGSVVPAEITIDGITGTALLPNSGPNLLHD
jgi:uncharacterized protein (TIGR03437 family)